MKGINGAYLLQNKYLNGEMKNMTYDEYRTIKKLYELQIYELNRRKENTEGNCS